MARERTDEASSGTPSAVVAGVLVAFGAVAVIMAVTGAVGSSLGLRLDGISTDRWRQAGVGGAAVASIALFACFLFGGYTAGRMTARKGALHGLLVFVVGAAVVGIVTLLAATWGDPGQVADNLRGNGVPTDASTWSDIGIAALAIMAGAMLLGSVLGGHRGAGWHALRAEDERRRVEAERTYRGDTEVVDLRDEADLQSHLPSVEEEREHRRSTTVGAAGTAGTVGTFEQPEIE